MMKWKSLIADRLKKGLEIREWNQPKFAKEADMRVSFVNRVLQAEANLTLQTICKLEEVLGYDLISIPSTFEQSSLDTRGSVEAISGTKGS